MKKLPNQTIESIDEWFHFSSEYYAKFEDKQPFLMEVSVENPGLDLEEDRKGGKR